jgi:hypothetical protein
MRLEDRIIRALDETGLPWKVVNGGVHHRVLLAGRQVLVVSRGAKSREKPRRTSNGVSAIRRAAKQIRSESSDWS